MARTRRPWLPALILSGLLGTTVPAAESLVTLEQILADPTDKQLSYTFARQRVRSGQLGEASFALKQVLQVDPTWDAARLFHGIVLFRLGYLKASHAEFAALSGRPLATDQQEEVARYMALIKARTGEADHAAAFLPVAPRPDAIASVFAFGTSRISAPDEGPDGAKRIEDAFSATANVTEESQTSSSHGSLLFLGLAGGEFGGPESSAAEQVPSTAAAPGETLSLGKLRISSEVLSVSFGTGDFAVAKDGAALSLAYPLSDDLSLTLSGSAVHQKETTPFGPADDDQIASVALGLAAGPFPGTSLAGTARLISAASPSPLDNYRGIEFHGSAMQSLGMGQFLLGEVWYWNLRDFSEDALRPFQEDGAKLRLAYGMPLSAASDAMNISLHPAFGSISLLLAGTYLFPGSEAASHPGESVGGEVSLKKAVAF